MVQALRGIKERLDLSFYNVGEHLKDPVPPKVEEVKEEKTGAAEGEKTEDKKVEDK